ncbi:MAG: hypothetical protein ABIJ65_11005, partial [Chloroflexota bacterium]
STLNVGNMIVFRVTGRDSYALASQFDNSPPPSDTRVEPIFREYEYQGVEALIETRLNTGEGKLYQEVELPRRPYSDVEAETANGLSILPNFEAMCHLIHIPGGGKRPSLVEHHIVTEVLGEQLFDPKVAEWVRERSRKLAIPRLEVEKDINRRSLGEIGKQDIETAEVLR